MYDKITTVIMCYSPITKIQMKIIMLIIWTKLLCILNDSNTGIIFSIIMFRHEYVRQINSDACMGLWQRTASIIWVFNKSTGCPSGEDENTDVRSTRT